MLKKYFCLKVYNFFFIVLVFKVQICGFKMDQKINLSVNKIFLRRQMCRKIFFDP